MYLVYSHLRVWADTFRDSDCSRNNYRHGWYIRNFAAITEGRALGHRLLEHSQKVHVGYWLVGLILKLKMLDINTLTRSPYMDSLPNREVMKELHDIRLVNVGKSASVGFCLLNKHMIGKAIPIVAIGGFLGSLGTPDRAWEGAQLATLKRPVLMLDLPGHGLSTKHSFRQGLDLTFRRKPDSQAAPLSKAINLLIGPGLRFDLFGISHGALMAVVIANQDKNDRVGVIFGIDLPAVKKRRSLGLAFAMAKDGVVGMNAYKKTLENTHYQDDYEKFTKAYQRTYRPKLRHPVKNNPLLFTANIFASVNARESGLEFLKSTIKNKQCNRRLVTSANSSVSNYRPIEKFIKSLDQKDQRRCSRLVIQCEDHNIGTSYVMPRAVAWAKEAYVQSSPPEKGH